MLRMFISDRYLQRMSLAYKVATSKLYWLYWKQLLKIRVGECAALFGCLFCCCNSFFFPWYMLGKFLPHLSTAGRGSSFPSIFLGMQIFSFYACIPSWPFIWLHLNILVLRENYPYPCFFVSFLFLLFFTHPSILKKKKKMYGLPLSDSLF